MAKIVLDGVTKLFANEVIAVNNVTLEIGDGEFMVLVGPSGCGKSTILRLLAGLEDVTAGEIEIGDNQVTDLEPKERDIAMVFQNYALYPHMNVRQNIAYGLKVRRTPKDETKRRVEEVAALLGLEKLLDRRPAQLSGGQRQRVAMGRAIVREPKAFLMDEPLSNLDAKLRVGMRASLAQLHQRLGVTTVYVTHDQTEAMTLGQRVAVINEGRVLQCDTPQRLYDSPDNVFVAAFIGTPAMNLVEASIDGDDVLFGGFRLRLDERRRPEGAPAKVILGIRPEAFEESAAPGASSLEVIPAVVEELGSEAHIFFPVNAPPVTAEILERSESDEATLLPESKALFAARLGPETRARVGVPLELAVNPARLHFFDTGTGARLPTVAAQELAAAR